VLSIATARVASVDTSNDTITVENLSGTSANPFKVNDLFIIQVISVNNDLESGGSGSIVKSIKGAVTDSTNATIEVSITSGSLSQVAKGDTIVGIGNTSDADRQSIMYRNVDRSTDNLIMRLQTGVNNHSGFLSVDKTRVAFGDLNGYSGLSSETFGFFAGDNSNEHALITSSGVFFKNNTTVLAQLSSNTFKVGDSTNFLSFNGSSFDIATTSFSLNTANLDISSANENIVIGTGSNLVTVGRIDSNTQGIKFETTGISGQNFWRLGQGNVQFKVGDGTNFLSFDENAGSFDIQSRTFTLDTTASGSGIKIDSSNQQVQLKDANRVRTQIDVNNGSASLTETTEYNANDATVITQGTPFLSSAFQTTKGDSLYIDVSAELNSLGTDGTEAYIQVEALGSTSSSGTYTSFASFLSAVYTATSQTKDTRFSAHSYSFDFVKIKITVVSNDTALNAEFELDENIVVKSYDSQTRVSLDGIFVNSSDNQFARLTRSANELSGIIKLTNLPTSKPTESGILYKESDGTLKVS